TAPSWAVAATPVPPPSPVQDPAGYWVCYGTKLQWLPPTNAAASPVQQYLIMAGGLQLAGLPGDATSYNDPNAVSSNGVAITYTIIAQNSSGESSNSVIVTTANANISCDPAPL